MCQKGRDIIHMSLSYDLLSGQTETFRIKGIALPTSDERAPDADGLIDTQPILKL